MPNATSGFRELLFRHRYAISTLLTYAGHVCLYVVGRRARNPPTVTKNGEVRHLHRDVPKYGFEHPLHPGSFACCRRRLVMRPPRVARWVVIGMFGNSILVERACVYTSCFCCFRLRCSSALAFAFAFLAASAAAAAAVSVSP